MSDAPTLLTADDPGLSSSFGPPQWGIFDQSGNPILTVDSVASVEWLRDYHVSDYPQEEGAWASYNKVQTPYQAKVGFLIGPSRRDFLNAVEAAAASLQFVSIVTPEVTYQNANLTHVHYRREVREGVTLIRVEVWAEEIRIVSGTLSNSNTAATGSPQTGALNQTPGLGGGSGNLSIKFPGAGEGSGAAVPQSTNAATPTESGIVQPEPAADVSSAVFPPS